MEHRIVKIVSAGVVHRGGVVALSGLVSVVAADPHTHRAPSNHLATNYHIATTSPGKDFSSEAKFILKLEFQARFPLTDDQTLWLSLHSVRTDHLEWLKSKLVK